MLHRSLRISLISSISIFRLVAALAFALLAFATVNRLIIGSLYLMAMVSDVLDGYAARKLNAETNLGKVLDLVGDKSLTIVSLLYAAKRGINLFPLAMIGTREIIMMGARMIIVEGTQLFPTNRVLGGLMWLLLWGNTLLLILAPNETLVDLANAIYWICAIIFLINFLARLHASANRIRLSLDTTALDPDHGPTQEPVQRGNVATRGR